MWSQRLICHLVVVGVGKSNGLRAVDGVHRGSERTTLTHSSLRLLLLLLLLCEHVGSRKCTLMLHQVRRFRVKTHACRMLTRLC